MDNNLVRLVIILSVLLLIGFPFVGLIPLKILAFIAFCGLGFRLWGRLVNGGNATAPKAEPE